MSTLTTKPKSAFPSPLWPAAHDLPNSLRLQVIPLLNRQLADALDLGLQAKQAHWNVKGPQFTALHGLFDEVAEALHELADELAERAVELGGLAQGTLQAVHATTRLPAYDGRLLAGTDHLHTLGYSLAHFAQTTRVAIDEATAAGDATSADVLTQVSRGVDKLLWKLSAHHASGN